MPKHKRRAHLLKIGVSGIRGVVGEFLNPPIATSFGQAFGTYVGGGRVVVGRDTRSSGPMLQHAVTCGLLASGCDVVDVGVIPTPTLQIYIAATGARGGIALTASHNPSEYNALKLFNGGGQFFNNYERGELLDLYHERTFREASNDEVGALSQDAGTPRRIHFDRVLAHVEPQRIRDRAIRVALDGVNGAGSLPSVEFLGTILGCKLTAIHVNPELPFPRVPEPRPDTLGELCELVRTSGSEIGFGQDPDGDRLAVVDENGNVFDNDDVLALAVDCALRRKRGDVAVNLTTSSVIDDVAAWHNCRVHRTPVGEANVVERMLLTNAVIGGEGSNGGIIFPAVHFCRDSYTGMAFLLDRMSETGKTISGLAAELPRYYRRMEQVPYQHGRLGPLMVGLESRFPNARLDRSDGLKILFDSSWIHVRSSNTEPILRVAVEAPDKAAADALFEEAARLLRG